MPHCSNGRYLHANQRLYRINKGKLENRVRAMAFARPRKARILPPPGGLPRINYHSKHLGRQSGGAKK
jgi:hypothetical protein